MLAELFFVIYNQVNFLFQSEVNDLIELNWTVF